MLNKYYQKHKERLQKEARERYQNLYEEGKDKRRKKFRDKFQNLPEEKKQKLCECMKKYYLAHKKQLFSLFREPRTIKLASRIHPWNVSVDCFRPLSQKFVFVLLMRAC